MTSPAAAAATAYVAAVNARNLEVLVGLFAEAGVLRHPSGEYARHAAIAGFYTGMVFPGEPQLTITRLLAEGNVAMVEIAATSPFGAPGTRQHVVDVLVVDDSGKITVVDVYYR